MKSKSFLILPIIIDFNTLTNIKATSTVLMKTAKFQNNSEYDKQTLLIKFNISSISTMIHQIAIASAIFSINQRIGSDERLN